jgi:hypothetical protein
MSELWQDVVAWSAVALACAYLGCRAWNQFVRKKAGGCGGCNSCPQTPAKSAPGSLPLVPLDALRNSARR